MQFFHEIPDPKIARLASVALLISSSVALIVTIWTRCWFMLLVPLTGFLIAAGYVYRVTTISEPTMSNVVKMQILLIVPPVLLAAANYACLSYALRHAHKLGKPWFSRLPTLFIVSDIACLLLQMSGAPFLANKDPAKMRIGAYVILVGVLLALAVNLLFMGVIVYMHFTMTFNIRPEFWTCLYATMICLTIRNIFRTIQFIQDIRSAGHKGGYLSSREIYLYLFDFMLIFTCIIIFAALPYGMYLNTAKHRVSTENNHLRRSQSSSTPHHKNDTGSRG